MIVDLADWPRLAAVDPVVAEWSEEVVPGAVEELPHSRYSPRYAWMYAYEKRLKQRICRALGRPLGDWERRLFGPDGAFSEGLSNAFLHGHRRDPERPIGISCRVGSGGLQFVIRDQGGGFDVAAALGALGRGAGYYHMAGNGLRCLAESPHVLAALGEGGRALFLGILFVSSGTAAAPPVSPPRP